MLLRDVPPMLAALLVLSHWSSALTLPAKSKTDSVSSDESPEMILLRIDEDKIQEVVATTTTEVSTTEENSFKSTTTPEPGGSTGGEGDKVDPLSVVWYLGAFGGLIAFFLVVTCSEWCCGHHRPYSGGNRRNNPYLGAYGGAADTFTPRTPPPPYHLFAPPDYQESVKREQLQDPSQGPKSPSIFIIPVTGATT